MNGANVSVLASTYPSEGEERRNRKDWGRKTTGLETKQKKKKEKTHVEKQ